MLDDSTARDLALAISLQFEGDDIPLLAPLADASLVWLDDKERSCIATPHEVDKHVGCLVMARMNRPAMDTGGGSAGSGHSE